MIPKKYLKYTVGYNSLINETILKIQNNERGDLLVEKKGKIIGTISGGDILRAVLDNKDLNGSIQVATNFNFKFLKKRDLKEAKKIFLKFGISLIPIIDKNFQLKSVITLNEILKKNI